MNREEKPKRSDSRVLKEKRADAGGYGRGPLVIGYCSAKRCPICRGLCVSCGELEITGPAWDRCKSCNRIRTEYITHLSRTGD